MTVLKRRSRMVSFRLSEQEYESLLTLCSSRGARSLSDLARDAMQALLHDGQGDGLPSLVHQLRTRMDDLDLQVKQLTQLLAAQKSASAAGSH
jgi:hypothetical protein